MDNSKFQYVIVDNERLLVSYSVLDIRYRVLFKNHIQFIEMYPLVSNTKNDIKKAKEIIKNKHKVYTAIKVIYAESYLN